jgi:hypothetical protein
MPQIKIAGFFHTFTDGHVLLVPEHRMPFPKSPKKVLHEFEAEFYRASPLFYPTTVEVRVDADFDIVEALHLNTRLRLVTVLGRVESRPSRGIEQPWVIAQKIVTHGDISDRAYEIHLSARGGSPEDDWLRAEDELLSS